MGFRDPAHHRVFFFSSLCITECPLSQTSRGPAGPLVKYDTNVLWRTEPSYFTNPNRPLIPGPGWVPAGGALEGQSGPILLENSILNQIIVGSLIESISNRNSIQNRTIAAPSRAGAGSSQFLIGILFKIERFRSRTGPEPDRVNF